VCDQAKALLVQNCYLAVSLELQPKKSLDKYAQNLAYFSNLTGEAQVGWRFDDMDVGCDFCKQWFHWLCVSLKGTETFLKAQLLKLKLCLKY